MTRDDLTLSGGGPRRDTWYDATEKDRRTYEASKGPQGAAMTRRTDSLDHVNAFRAGFRHGQDVGLASPREAEEVLRSFARPVDSTSIDCFCNGSGDGAKGDQFRYLATYLVQIVTAATAAR